MEIYILNLFFTDVEWFIFGFYSECRGSDWQQASGRKLQAA
jgi:hypothetical protein